MLTHASSANGPGEMPTFDKTAEQLRLQSTVLETLFPGTNVALLVDKSQSELLDMLNIAQCSPRNQTLHQAHVILPSVSLPFSHAPGQGEAGSLEPGQAAESAPVSENGDAEEDRKWNETPDQLAPVASDDINALGLASDQDHARSYLGVTSMSAVFRTIFRLCPVAKEYAVNCAEKLATVPVQAHLSLPMLGRDPALGIVREQRCIKFYFEVIHPITPLLDEEDFLSQYHSGTRQDGSWLGLLKMVLALGSIASGSEGLHEQYYKEARSFTGLDSLGSGNLESLQALCLLGGYYLHYRNSPNMAFSILGAAHRVAIALGLHREPRKVTNISDQVGPEIHRNRVETRRRTWWSLYCLDTWACMTQGRPTCGRWETTTMDTHKPSCLFPDDQAAIFLCANINFCLVFERIQIRFAQFHRLSTKEILAFDAELLTWYNELPLNVKQGEGCPHRFQFAKELMKTRYYNARVILARSLMLYLAHDCKRKAYELYPEQRQILDRCCSIAAETIDSTASYWSPNRIHVWNQAWYLFQACTVPLLAIAMERNMQQYHPQLSPPASEKVLPWQTSLAKALETFVEMRPSMRVSDRSPDIVSALYEALTANSDNHTPSATDGSLDLFGWCDDQLNEMDWSVFIGDESLARGMYPM
ncbi:hypothetical protein QQS21_004977 [Conoideocrella luteorostrata]|uniref:Xylanolytic transcriptional activator regulatory domain-containing protein n=1 Tax=Conoideocrella luteorostrata TaxID=1105319 RepID=A0AAJ0CRA5_9HYPO|nr:hypothetical protein QQS21_004977 [Conoideocrella luteorostrata]